MDAPQCDVKLHVPQAAVYADKHHELSKAQARKAPLASILDGGALAIDCVYEPQPQSVNGAKWSFLIGVCCFLVFGILTTREPPRSTWLVSNIFSQHMVFGFAGIIFGIIAAVCMIPAGTPTLTNPCTLQP